MACYYCHGLCMTVFCHGFKCANGLISYKGLNKIEDVDEVVFYNEKGKAAEVIEKLDCDAVAIFAPTIFVVKKNDKYYWCDVILNVKDAKTIDGLKNGKNYMKRDGTWMLLEETD